jgi:precorrin-2/cobalt-factor-2 C20-methyltransferase
LRNGVFYGVGVGPGDPELITLKAINVLKSSAVIAVPRSSDKGSSRALDIIKGVFDFGGKEILELPLPMTKDRAALDASRREAATLVAQRLDKGQDVAFITLGDPLIFSTFSYLVPFVKELSPLSGIKAVPGVTSFSAAASLQCVPLAETDERVIIVPAAYELEKVREALASADTVVLMKVNRAIDGIIELLTGAGLIDKAFFVSRAGWPEEEVVTDLNTIKGTKPDYFSMIIIRKNG